ncbi:MAG: hypothetical protein AB9869_17735 [Verrucomicrobiia bacterium]
MNNWSDKARIRLPAHPEWYEGRVLESRRLLRLVVLAAKNLPEVGAGYARLPDGDFCLMLTRENIGTYVDMVSGVSFEYERLYVKPAPKLKRRNRRELMRRLAA